VLVLSSAYFIQYVLNHQPCNLCLIERVPYLLTIILISLIFILKKFQKTILFFIFLLFVFGSLISFYHVGIEQGFFSETFVCNLSDTEKILSSSELLEELKNKTVSCKDVTITFFGLSLATFNTIISLFLSFIIGYILKNYDKN
jgi:disulfide bond formation protein DsbB